MQAVIILVAVLVPAFAGFSLSFTVLARDFSRSRLFLALSLSPAIGILLSSVLYFFWSLLFHPDFYIRRYLLLETGLFLIFSAVIWLLWYRRNRPGLFVHLPRWKKPAFFPRLSTLLGIGAFAVLLLTFGLVLARWQAESFRYPHGDWDAMAIWNLRARFIYSGEQWLNGFSPVIYWSHPDYPLLLPLTVARLWVLVGSSTQMVPVFVELAFILSIMTVILSGVAAVRGWKASIIAGLFLVPMFSTALQWKQYADLPVGFYFLATSILFFLADSTSENNTGILALAGLAGGAALWTKNEGWALLVAVGVAELVRLIWKKDRLKNHLRRWGAVALGLLPMLIVVLIFKSFSGQQNDIVSGNNPSALMDKVFDVSRYVLISKEFVKCFIANWGLKLPYLPLLVFFVFLAGFRIQQNQKWEIISLAVRIAMIGVVYFGIYLLTPADLAWHIEASMNRLVAQVIPSLIFLALVSAQGFDQSPTQA